MTGSIERTVIFEYITPSELAAAFTEMSSDEQAQFFEQIWLIAKDWPGAGWCQQSYSIAEALTADGRSAIATLAAHVTDEVQS